MNKKITDLEKKLVVALLNFGLGIICRISIEGLQKIPSKGPLILYGNHTGTIEVPILFVVVQPRVITGLAKVESWDNPVLSWLFDLFGFIPVRRGELDLDAFKRSINWLKDSHIIGISPEGTRNRDGILLKAHPGIVTLALRSGALLMPVAHWGGEKLRSNIKKFKRTEFNIKVGEQYRIQIGDTKLDRKVRQQIVDEMMFELADLLPEEYRGVYIDRVPRTNRYLKRIQ
ncbi:lysophospholipid acyltransferase family protein [Chloroflexota bacterium]